MKKIALFGIAVSMACAAWAAQNDLLVSFSTKGPDKYADGSVVIDKECYALVWTPKGVESASIAADGTAAGGAKIVLVAPIARNGRCPKVVYRVDAARAETEFSNGGVSSTSSPFFKPETIRTMRLLSRPISTSRFSVPFSPFRT